MKNGEISGNKGEWSKIYALFKFVADGKIFSDEFSYPITTIKRNNIEIIREITPENLVLVKDSITRSLIKKIRIREFRQITPKLYDKIISGTGAFPIPFIENFISKIGIKNLNTPHMVSDLTIILKDPRTDYQKSINFLVKSKIGSLPTFFNASMGSNITYKIVNAPLNDAQINEINNLKTNNDKIDVKGRVNKLYEYGCLLKFYKIEKNTFNNNLTLIDRDLPLILSQLLLYYFKGMGKRLNELLDIVKTYNPCDYDLNNNQDHYKRRIQDFLTESFIGMTASKAWKSPLDKHEGIIIVEKDGSLSCYHGFLKNDFRDYIVRNTKFDTPSAKRHKFVRIVRRENDLFLKLNFQIRWII